MIYTLYTDGGSRGNPGSAAAGYVIEGPEIGRIEQGDYIGIATNNVAEYSAVIFGLARLKAELGAERAKQVYVRVMADSELMVKQANGQYKVKNAALMQLFIKLHNLRQDFAQVTFTHIRRELNTAADRMVNQALDEHKKSTSGSH